MLNGIYKWILFGALCTLSLAAHAKPHAYYEACRVNLPATHRSQLIVLGPLKEQTQPPIIWIRNTPYPADVSRLPSGAPYAFVDVDDPGISHVRLSYQENSAYRQTVTFTGHCPQAISAILSAQYKTAIDL